MSIITLTFFFSCFCLFLFYFVLVTAFIFWMLDDDDDDDDVVLFKRFTRLKKAVYVTIISVHKRWFNEEFYASVVGGKLRSTFLWCHFSFSYFPVVVYDEGQSDTDFLKVTQLQYHSRFPWHQTQKKSTTLWKLNKNDNIKTTGKLRGKCKSAQM